MTSGSDTPPYWWGEFPVPRQRPRLERGFPSHAPRAYFFARSSLEGNACSNICMPWKSSMCALSLTSLSGSVLATQQHQYHRGHGKRGTDWKNGTHSVGHKRILGTFVKWITFPMQITSSLHTGLKCSAARKFSEYQHCFNHRNSPLLLDAEGDLHVVRGDGQRKVAKGQVVAFHKWPTSRSVLQKNVLNLLETACAEWAQARHTVPRKNKRKRRKGSEMKGNNEQR